MAKRGRARHPDILTPREWDVLALVREGLTNEQIAERLEITERTARFHVSEILRKLGVSSRHEAAAWSPEERRPWWSFAFAPLSFGRAHRWLATAAASATIAIGVAGLALLVWGITRPDGTNDDADVFAAPSNSIIALSRGGGITLLDPTTGTVTGDALSGASALFRGTRDELLVVSSSGLEIYGIDDLSRPRASVELPGLRGYTVWHQQVVLSEQEKYLYYAKVDAEAVRRRCPNGGDGNLCDVAMIGIVDLEAKELLPDAYIGPNCMLGLQADHGSDSLAICQDPRVNFSTDPLPNGVLIQRVTPDGMLTPLASFTARRGASDFYSPSFVGSSRDARWYMVYNDGVVFLENEPSPHADVLASDDHKFSFNTSFPLADGQQALAIQDRVNPTEESLLGAVVFDAADPQSAQTYMFPNPVDHVASIGDGRLALLTARLGTIQIFDLRENTVVWEFDAPDGAEWLVGRP